MAHQVAGTGSSTRTDWNSWSIWRTTNANRSNAQQRLPDQLPTNKHHCRKCLRVFGEQREVAEHEAKCLKGVEGGGQIFFRFYFIDSENLEYVGSGTFYRIEKACSVAEM